MSSTKYLELPVGVDELGGIVRRTVEIRKIKGNLQRDIAKMQQQKKPDMALLIDTILMPTVLTLDGTPMTLLKLRQMSLADRDWLLYECRKHTWGNFVTASDTCETCDPPTKMVYPDMDLSALPVQRLEDDVCWWNGKDVVPGEAIKSLSAEDRAALSYRVLVIENPDMDVRGVFRLPNGKDQGALSSLSNQPIEALWRLMSLTCLQWSDPEHPNTKIDPKRGLKDDFWGDLDADVLGWTQAAFQDGQPGIDTIVELTCEVGHTKKARLQAADFFFPEVTKPS